VIFAPRGDQFQGETGKNFRWDMRTAAWIFCLSGLLLGGCVVSSGPYYRVRQVRPAGLSSEEVLKMSKAGIADSVITEKLRSEGIARRPTADDVVSLKKEGLSDAVIDAMLTATVAPEQSVEVVYDYPYYSYGYASPYYYYPYYYPYSYYPYYYGYGYYPYYHGYYHHGYYPYHGGYNRGSASVSHYRR
jgi:hypothetical protein